MNRQQKERTQYLLMEFMEGTASAEQRKELSLLLQSEQNDREWEDLMEEIYSATTPAADMNEAEWQPMIEELVRINRKQDAGAKKQGKRVSMLFRRIAVAASVLLVIGLGGYFLFFNKGNKTGEIVQTELQDDVKAPQTNRAMITLIDGRQIYLDSVSDGSLAVQGNIKLVKLSNGQIAYEAATGNTVNELQYNTLFNPRGSKVVDMTLSDGSRVWLNAGSSVRYPVAFTGNERKVEITGEAYFEVAHDRSKPFVVSKGETSVTVLGTHFNVNAYDDEESIKVTLLEGKVQLAVGSKQLAVLKPGEQASFNIQNLEFKINSSPDIEEVMAWKNGLFSFRRADIKMVMRQLARWYDVEVVFEGKPPTVLFGGEIQRDIPLSSVVKNLEKNGVRFKIEAKKITVKE